LIGDPIYDVYSEPTSGDNENETHDVDERDTHIISPHLEMEASGQLQDMAVSFVAKPNSMEAFIITENHMNQGLQADHIHVQQNPSENEIHITTLSESESKNELCDSTKCEGECLYIESTRDKPHKVKVNETMLCEDFSETTLLLPFQVSCLTSCRIARMILFQNKKSREQLMFKKGRMIKD
jgi:hypothetical protein